MFVNTHTLIAKSIVNNIDENKHFFLMKIISFMEI